MDMLGEILLLLLEYILVIFIDLVWNDVISFVILLFKFCIVK